jgi:hypothetical protein
MIYYLSCDAFEESRNCPCFGSQRPGSDQGVRLEASMVLLRCRKVVGLGSVESVAAQSSGLFDLERLLGLHQHQPQPSMGSLLLQPFCEQLTFGSYDLV